MKCPCCSHNIKSTRELVDNYSDVPWYKYRKQNPLRCPNCKAQVDILEPKQTKITNLVSLPIVVIGIIIYFIYSDLMVLNIVLFFSLGSQYLAERLSVKYGKLILSHTTHNKSVKQTG